MLRDPELPGDGRKVDLVWKRSTVRAYEQAAELEPAQPDSTPNAEPVRLRRCRVPRVHDRHRIPTQPDVRDPRVDVVVRAEADPVGRS